MRVVVPSQYRRPFVSAQRTTVLLCLARIKNVKTKFPCMEISKNIWMQSVIFVVLILST